MTADTAIYLSNGVRIERADDPNYDFCFVRKGNSTVMVCKWFPFKKARLRDAVKRVLILEGEMAKAAVSGKPYSASGRAAAKLKDEQ